MNGLPDLPDSCKERYRAFDTEGWVGWINREFEGDGVEQILFDPYQLFEEKNVVKWHKNKRNRLAEVRWSVGLNPDAFRTVVLKSYESDSFYNTLRLLLGPPRAVRHWDRVWLLNGRKVNTPQPVFIALPKVNARAKAQGLIAVETVTDHQRIREILTDDLSPQTILNIGSHKVMANRFARICGQYVREIHDKHLVHRDFSGANILIPAQWDGSSNNLALQFVMLDINRIRPVPQGRMSMNLRIQDLERLYMPESLLDDYFSAYATDDLELQSQRQKFLKYRKAYRRIRETESAVERGLLKTFTYWHRTG